MKTALKVLASTAVHLAEISEAASNAEEEISEGTIKAIRRANLGVRDASEFLVRKRAS